jgi:hypothetical protein
MKCICTSITTSLLDVLLHYSSVFCRLTSQCIRLSRYSRKMMVASKRHEELYWFNLESYVQSQRRSSACSSLECSKVLTMEVQEWWKR